MTPTWLLFAALLVLAACAQQPQGEPSAAAPSTTPAAAASATAPPAVAGNDLCFGRYALRLPAGSRVIGRDQSMLDLGLRTRELTPGTTLADAPNHAPWATRADLNTRIGPTVSPVSADTVVLTWRATDRAAALVDTEAVRFVGNLLIAAHGRGEGTDQVAAQRQAALGLVAAAAPRPAGVVPARGFCIDRFVIDRDATAQEFAGAAVETGRERRLYVTTRTNGAEPAPRLSQGGPGTAPAGISVVRAGARQAGGHPGDELVVSRARGRNRDMLLIWRFVGAPHSGTEPAVELRLEAGDVAAPETLLTEWEGLLAGLRRRGD